MPQKVRSLTEWHRPSVLAVASFSSTRVLVGGSVRVQAGSASYKIQAFRKIVPSIRGEKKAREFASYRSKDEDADQRLRLNELGRRNAHVRPYRSLPTY